MRKESSIELERLKRKCIDTYTGRGKRRGEWMVRGGVRTRGRY